MGGAIVVRGSAARGGKVTLRQSIHQAGALLKIVFKSFKNVPETIGVT